MAVSTSVDLDGYTVERAPTSMGRAVQDRPRIGLRRRLQLIDLLTSACAWTPVVLAEGDRSPVHTVMSTILALGLTVLGLHIQNLYSSRVCSLRVIELQRVGRVAVAVTAIRLLVDTHTSRGPMAVLLTLVVVFGSLALGRTAFDGWLRRQRTAGRYSRPVLMVGSGEEVASLHRVLRDHPETGVRVVGLTGDRPDVGADGPRWLGPLAMTVTVARILNPSAVIITATAVPWQHLNRLVRDLRRSGQRVLLSPGIQGIGPHQLSPSPMAYEPLLMVSEGPRLRRTQLWLKRALDVVGAVVALVLAAPVMLLTSAVILLTDGGPVLFRQERVGLGGRPFQILKFRSMVRDAERLTAELNAQNERQGPLFKITDDPRLIRGAAFMRATSIDELPQLLNVLRGEMSLVGPRPALPAEAVQFDADLQHRVDVPPGVSGLWQIEGRDSPSFSVFQRLDLFYVENWSIGLDITILIATVGAVVGRAVGYLGGRGRSRRGRGMW